MKLSTTTPIVSYGGYTFGTNEAAFPEQNFYPQASSQSVELARSDAPPVISTVKRQSKVFAINVYPPGVFTTNVDVYHGYFDPNDKSLHALVIKDNAGTSWYVMAKVEGEPHAYTDYLQFTLRVPDPVWQLVTPVSDVWSITATGQQHTITTTGNRSVFPIFNVVPTSVKAGGFAFYEYRAWYNPQSTVGMKDETIDLANHAWDTSALVNDTTASLLINQGGGINNSVTSIPYDTRTGTIPAVPYLIYCGTEQMLVTVDPGTASGSLTVTRPVGGTSAATHADNAVMAVSRMFADGRDIRLRLLGGGGAIDWPLWLSGVNTTTTKLFAVIDFAPGINMTLSGAMDDHTAVTTLSFKKTSNNLASLKKLGKKKFFAFAIGSEIFTFQTGHKINLTAYTITTTLTDSRGAYGSTKAAHADGAAIKWLEYIPQFCYGNPSLDAPDQDETQKPVINMTSGLNTSWVWDTNFWALGGLRAAQWRSTNAKSPGGQSQTYTGKHTLGADTTPDMLQVDPSTALGIWLAAYQQGTNWVGEQFDVRWTMYNAAGFTTATVVLALYRWSTDWPAKMCLQVSLDGITWSNVTGFPEAKPASAQVWTASAAHSAVALGATYPYVRLIALGAIAGNKPTNVIAMEASSVTLVRSSANIPQLAYTSSAKQQAYHLQATLTNVGTLDAVYVDYVLPLNQTVQIDCLNKNAIHVETGANIIGALTPNGKRNYWISIEPIAANAGVANGGKFQFDDTGTAGVTITTSYYDRIV